MVNQNDILVHPNVNLYLEFKSKYNSKTRNNFINPKTGWLMVENTPTIEQFKMSPSKYFPVPDMVMSDIFYLDDSGNLTLPWEYDKNGVFTGDRLRISAYFEDFRIGKLLQHISNGSIEPYGKSDLRYFPGVPEGSELYKVYFTLDKNNPTSHTIRVYNGVIDKTTRLERVHITDYYFIS